MTPEETIRELEQSVTHLLRNYREVCHQLTIFEEANEKQRQEILRSHAELVELQNKYKNLQTAHALLAETPERDIARKQLTSIIRKVDTTIALLKE